MPQYNTKDTIFVVSDYRNYMEVYNIKYNFIELSYRLPAITLGKFETNRDAVTLM